MSKWKLVYDESLKGQKCPYQVYCNGERIRNVFLEGNKRKEDQIIFSIYCDKRMSPYLTKMEVEALPTDSIRFFINEENKLNCCRIWATL